MNDADLTATLRAIHRGAASASEPPMLRARVLAIPAARPIGGFDRRRWARPRWGVAPTVARLVAAGAIVALGTGAFFFAASPSPTPAPVSSPSVSPSGDGRLITEAVEPGVVRIVNDGVRDVARPFECWSGNDCSWMNSNLAIAPDGAVWVFDPDEFYRLGDAATYATGEGPAWLDQHVEVAPDGAIWWVDLGRNTPGGSPRAG